METEKPKAYLIAHLGVFIPNAKNHETGDFAEAEAIQIPIYHTEGEDKKELPIGVADEILLVLAQLAELGRNHVPKNVIAPQIPKISMPDKPNVIGRLDKPKGSPTVQAFAVGPNGQTVALGKPVALK